MEVAGLVIDVAGIAGLFSACIDAVERVDSYNNFEIESRYITAHFETDKLLLKRWADGVGITDGKLKEQHHVDLDNDATAEVVAKLLSNISEVFNPKENKAWLRIGNQYDNGRVIPDKLRLMNAKASEDTRSQSLAHKADRVKWTLMGKTRFVAQVDAFETLVQKLYALISPLNRM